MLILNAVPGGYILMEPESLIYDFVTHKKWTISIFNTIRQKSES
jgi:hypothetical protein